jgi:peptide deformylase
MVRPIILYGNPILREASAEIDRKTVVELPKLISDMFETMHKANGIGLAAVQIGVPLRLFVVEAHITEDNFHFRETFINPKILREWGTDSKRPEGCLSVPGIPAIVERAESIEIEWYDEKWNYHKKNFSGTAARIIQHEYDHLRGKLYVDRLDTMWRSLLEQPLELIEKRQMEVPFLWK